MMTHFDGHYIIHTTYTLYEELFYYLFIITLFIVSIIMSSIYIYSILLLLQI